MKVLLPFALLSSIIDLNGMPPRLTPPDQYRHGTASVVVFVDTQEEMNKTCSGVAGPLPDGTLYVGCAARVKKTNIMLVSNPCNYSDDRYARSVCHEMGHINGWPADHPNPQ